MRRILTVLLIAAAGCAPMLGQVTAPRATRPAGKPLATASAAASQTTTEYLAVLLSGKKIGYAVQTRTIADGQVTSREDVSMTMGRGPASITVKQTEISVETTDGKPISFRSEMDMGAINKQIVEGKLRPDGKLDLTTVSGKGIEHKVIDWPEGAMLSEGLRLQERAKGLKRGTSYTSKSFSAETLKPLDAKIDVGDTVEIDLLGRVVRLTEVKSTISTGGLGTLEMTSYVDKDHNTLKTVSSLMGMKIEMISCSKEYAMSPVQDVDFFSRFLLDSPKSLKDLKPAAALVYELTPLENAKLKIIDTDSQKATTQPDGRVLVEIRPAAPKTGATFPYAGTDAAVLAATKPSRFAESDNEKIIALAKKAVGDEKDAGHAAHKLETFVREYITKKDLSVGYASAGETVESRQGDCTEHAVLLAAMCKAVGIPAQVVVGVAYVPEAMGKKDVFGPHAWVQAYVGDKWVGLDAALGHFDAGHIALSTGDGDPGDFFNLTNALGYFKITKIELKD